MLRKVVCAGIIFMLVCVMSFAQSASAVRDYVGRISQQYHPDLVEYMKKLKDRWEKEGNSDAVKAMDSIIKGKGGSGFIHVDAAGNNYIITNYHVVTQSYTLSVSFEKVDGTKTQYDNLKLIYIDEENDIALLAFPEGQKPFKAGMSFVNRTVEEGETVFSAGFPGLAGTQIWQFGQGIISNAMVRIPKPDDKDKTMGPYIQHTAQVDPGNSGGPLLVTQAGVPSGYAVVGINTLSARSRQAGNYSIPISMVNEFLASALGKTPVDERKILEERIDSFIKGLDASRAVYPHIAKYLSSICTAQNAEYSLDEMFEKAARTVQTNIVKTLINNFTEGMQEAVAWTIEDSLRGKDARIRASLGSITKTSAGYTVSFKVNDAVVESEWVKEFGIWRINTFGTIASGDKSLVAAREEKREQEKRAKAMNTDYYMLCSLAYTHILNRGPAGNAELRLKGEFYGFAVSVIYAGPDYLQWQGDILFEIPLRFASAGFAVLPYIQGGFGVIKKKNEKPLTPNWMDKISYFNAQFQTGVLVTTVHWPNVFFKGAYQGNYYRSDEEDRAPKPDKRLILVGVGYSF